MNNPKEYALLVDIVYREILNKGTSYLRTLFWDFPEIYQELLEEYREEIDFIFEAENEFNQESLKEESENVIRSPYKPSELETVEDIFTI